MSLAIVTASTNLDRARSCLASWIHHADDPVPIFLILNGCAAPNVAQMEIEGASLAWWHTPEYLGSVRAFRRGVDVALRGPFDVIACFHDDFEIRESHWDTKVLKYLARRPEIGLLGFGGATGLGSGDLYGVPYNPMQLARIGFRSDLEDAEVHGVRSLLAEPVACLDGFSQIGRRAFWEGWRHLELRSVEEVIGEGRSDHTKRPWQVLEDLGFRHHFYDGALGCLAARYGWETWYVPLRAKHYGGRTAVGDPGYQAWALTQSLTGDQGFWAAAHQIGYDAFKDVLPLRV